eukprot:6209479-Pleurochrysis_carterae.AAC.2
MPCAGSVSSFAARSTWTAMPAQCTSTPAPSTAPRREALASAFTLCVAPTATSTATESDPKVAGVSALAKPTTRGASTSSGCVIRGTTGVAGGLEVVALSSRDIPVSTFSH